MFKKIAKHRANDASLTMHRPPLGSRSPFRRSAMSSHSFPKHVGSDIKIVDAGVIKISSLPGGGGCTKSGSLQQTSISPGHHFSSSELRLFGSMEMIVPPEQRS